jgi:predicted peroxiredoxin
MESPMSKSILINCTHGAEDAERATLPFIVANVAATADQDSTVFLTAEAVRIATRGYADTVRAHDMKPLAEVMQSYLQNGGTIWACGACTGPRGITEADLIPGAQIVTAVNLVERLADGVIPLNIS